MNDIKKHWYCTKCGSNDVVADATATWDADKQDWEMSDICDGTWCQNCEYNGRYFELGRYSPDIVEFTDNAVTCGICGVRTTFEVLRFGSADEEVQLHKCTPCNYVFRAMSAEEEDDE